MRNILIDFGRYIDNRGSLTALEGKKTIPFDIKRVFYIYDLAKDSKRGVHATKTTEEVIICLKGSCLCRLDDGKFQEEITLDNPQMGLYIKEATWREIYNFSDDCIILSVSNKYYDPADDISDYDDFLKFTENDDEASEKHSH